VKWFSISAVSSELSLAIKKQAHQSNGYWHVSYFIFFKFVIWQYCQYRGYIVLVPWPSILWVEQRGKWCVTQSIEGWYWHVPLIYMVMCLSSDTLILIIFFK
jgi:hypothetical protein